MIVMRLDCDNFCGFNHFHICFSYPKKPVNSLIEENLKDFPNFRYKKVNVIMGTNASGKTTLGRIIMSVFNLIRWQNAAPLKSLIASVEREGTLLMDFIPDGKTLYRLSVVVDPEKGQNKQDADVKASIAYERIFEKDNYEKCAERLEQKKADFSTDLAEVFKDVPSIGWLFTYPEIEGSAVKAISKSNSVFPKILENVMKTLDSSVESVKRVSSAQNNDFIMKMENRSDSILIHDGEIQDSDKLKVSSGTRYGVRIASFISAVKEGSRGFYYCDEMFSYIQTDIEKAVLSVLVESLKDNDQLFFTTHNSSILDLQLPKHSFIFLRKDPHAQECQIEAMDASEYIKKNNVSVRNAAENDLFSSKPDLDKIYEIEEM